LTWTESPFYNKRDKLAQLWVQLQSVIVTIMTITVLKIASLITDKEVGKRD